MTNENLKVRSIPDGGEAKEMIENDNSQIHASSCDKVYLKCTYFFFCFNVSVFFKRKSFDV